MSAVRFPVAAIALGLVAALGASLAAAPLAITTVPPLFTGTVGVPYAQSFSASGGTAPYTWSIIAGDTGGLTLVAASGILQGTPQNAGTFNFTIQVADNAGGKVSQAFSLQINPASVTITVTAAVPSGTVGVPYNAKIPVVASGGTPPYAWSLTDGQIPGLDFDPVGVALSGTPTTAGSYSFTIQAADANGLNAARSLTLTIAPGPLTITTDRKLPDGSLTATYTAKLTALGGTPPYTWAANGLPAGLSLNSSTGEIGGTLTAAGNFAIAITVTDAALGHVSDRFTLNVSLPPGPTVTLTGLPAAASPAQQYALQVALGSSYPAAITGQLTLAFTPESGPVDKTVQFASGGTSATFSVAAGDSNITSSAPLAIQTGTVAGTIKVTLQLLAGGVDITPSPAPVLTAQIAKAAPVISAVQVTRGSNSIQCAISGYSTSREITQAVFNFSAASGQTLQSGASSLTVSVNSLFTPWFADPVNAQYGSQFLYTQPFTVQGDPNGVIPNSVTLTNATGSTTFNISK